MQELVEKRTINSKTFQVTPRRQRMIVTAEPLHWQDDAGQLHEFDTELVGGHMRQRAYEVELLRGRIGYCGRLVDGTLIEVEYADAPYVEPEIAGNCATFRDVRQDEDVVFTFLPNTIRVHRILKSPAADRVATYRVFQSPSGHVRLLNKGHDALGQQTQLECKTEPAAREGEVRLTQVWTGNVAVVDPVTRKRSWAPTAAYPVAIDPSVIGTLGTGASDGSITSDHVPVTGFQNGSYYAMLGKQYYSSGQWFEARSFFCFSVTGVPQGSTIVSATLHMQVAFPRRYGIAGAETTTVQAIANHRSAAGVPTSFAAVTAITPINSLVSAATWTINRVSKSGSPSTNAADFTEQEIDVTDIVSALVAAHDYTNPALMVFVARGVQQITGVSTGDILRVAMREAVTDQAYLVIELATPDVPPDKTVYHHG